MATEKPEVNRDKNGIWNSLQREIIEALDLPDSYVSRSSMEVSPDNDRTFSITFSRKKPPET